MTESPTRDLLVIDDEESICLAFRRFFERRGWRVRAASSASRGEREFATRRPDVVFLDVRLPDADGLDVLRRLREADASVPIVMVTAFGGLQTVVGSMREQAFDYLPKPIDLDQAERVAQRATESGGGTVAAQTAAPPGGTSGEEMIGTSPAMQSVFKRIAVLANSDCAVLILGATGTGKEMVARAIHAHSPRRDKPFVAVNCGAVPENLVESELFGHVRGAFTGAESDRVGKFEAADGGTLFLDEVGELPAPAQVKLLRVLDSQVIERVGSVEPRKLDVRVMAATNRPLATDVEAGRFRADLYYRLAVVEVEVPTLAKRLEDIVPLARHFLAQANAAAQVEADAEAALRAYSWPGNVRELRNAMIHALAVAPRGGERIRREDLPEAVRRGAPALGGPVSEVGALARRYAAAVAEATGEDEDGLLAAAVRPVEESLIRRAMEACGGRQTDAAGMLGLHRNTLRKKLREYGIES